MLLYSHIFDIKTALISLELTNSSCQSSVNVILNISVNISKYYIFYIKCQLFINFVILRESVGCVTRNFRCCSDVKTAVWITTETGMTTELDLETLPENSGLVTQTFSYIHDSLFPILRNRRRSYLR